MRQHKNLEQSRDSIRSNFALSFNKSRPDQSIGRITPLRAAYFGLGLLLGCAVALGAPAAPVDEPFYKGKRLTLLINFAAGGPTDIEGRLFARHVARHIAGQPSIVIQNMDGAGGIVGAKYAGEVAPRDGTFAGYFTGTAFMYALDPDRFRVDFKTYAFVATQAGTTVHFARTDIEPGLKQATDISKAKGIILGGLSVDTPKDLRARLGMDMLGIPYKYVTGYRSSPAARLAFQRGEINLFSESPPSYRGVVEPALVKTGQAIPIFYDPGYDGRDFSVPDGVNGLAIPAFHLFYQAIKGAMPSGELWEIYKAIISTDGIIQRVIVMPPEAPQAAVEALRAAISRLHGDKAYAQEAEKTFGFVPQWEAGADTATRAQAALMVRPQVRAFLADYMKNLPR
jgi:putative tricarboxylic transport membrane protein